MWNLPKCRRGCYEYNLAISDYVVQHLGFKLFCLWQTSRQKKKMYGRPLAAPALNNEYVGGPLGLICCRPAGKCSCISGTPAIRGGRKRPLRKYFQPLGLTESVARKRAPTKITTSTDLQGTHADRAHHLFIKKS